MRNITPFDNREKWAEVERMREAGKRTVERATQDPEFREQLLRDIKYYEIMKAWRAYEAQNGQPQEQDGDAS